MVQTLSLVFKKQDQGYRRQEGQGWAYQVPGWALWKGSEEGWEGWKKQVPPVSVVLGQVKCL